MSKTDRKAPAIARHVRLGAMCLFVCALVCATFGVALAKEPGPATTQAIVTLQTRQLWRFDEDAVTFSNRFDGARLDNVERLGERRYRLTITPETLPINPSPWYGFAVSSDAPQQLELTFHYTESKARYLPWLSRDGGRSWHNPTPTALTETAAGDVSLQVDSGPLQLLVWAQRPVQLEDFECWEAGLRQRAAIDEAVIGASALGRPLRMLAFGNPDASRVLLVLGRQHPPETTGSRALMAFVDALAADTAEASAFRASTRVLVVPVMNPDGVIEGHWRTNAHGIDLNRDWGSFGQPETRAVRDMLQREVRDRGHALAFALDFHSTRKDIFYTVTDDPSRAPGGVLRRWMDAMQARYPDRITEAPGNNPDTGVFKGWAFSEYGAPAVTYEVGDSTTDGDLHELATFAATSLAMLLADGNKVDRGSP